MPLVFQAGLPFLVNAFLLSSVLTRVPDIQAVLGVDKATLGLALFAAPFATMLTLTVVGRLVERVGERAATSWAGVAMAIALVPVGFASHWLAFAAALLALGAANAVMEVGMNLASARAEQHYRQNILSRSHGFWSFGMVGGALISGVLAELGISVTAHLIGAAAAGILFSLALRPVFPKLPPQPAREGSGSAAFSLPSVVILGVCVMAAGVTMAEGAVYDWSTLFLRQVLDASPFYASLGYAIFALVQATGRMFGDAVRARIDGVRIVQFAAVAAIAGLVGLATAPNIVVAWVALGVIGLGVSLVYPVASAAAASRGGPGAAANLAGLTLVTMMALLTGPPVIGLISEAFGLPAAFLALVPLSVLSFLFAGHARIVARPAGT
ncbi:MFS transporter [Methylobrevis albus]|uniref:MFS transporter n=1 Tax=Methylobrevis albus TaxID=2793297 RepID=A0A931MXZ7_9HYPH|nr:MFS transporter [Methylobrevis albus]MBH0236559.1 MFS transporter [Methylobrevis albus]